MLCLSDRDFAGPQHCSLRDALSEALEPGPLSRVARPVARPKDQQPSSALGRPKPKARRQEAAEAWSQDAAMSEDGGWQGGLQGEFGSWVTGHGSGTAQGGDTLRLAASCFPNRRSVKKKWNRLSLAPNRAGGDRFLALPCPEPFATQEGMCARGILRFAPPEPGTVPSPLLVPSSVPGAPQPVVALKREPAVPLELLESTTLSLRRLALQSKLGRRFIRLAAGSAEPGSQREQRRRHRVLEAAAALVGI